MAAILKLQPAPTMRNTAHCKQCTHREAMKKAICTGYAVASTWSWAGQAAYHEKAGAQHSDVQELAEISISRQGFFCQQLALGAVVGCPAY
ncbi:hypothetical protein HaLaN_17268, partial [Haematococcus lacustris]